MNKFGVTDSNDSEHCNGGARKPGGGREVTFLIPHFNGNRAPGSDKENDSSQDQRGGSEHFRHVPLR